MESVPAVLPSAPERVSCSITLAQLRAILVETGHVPVYAANSTARRVFQAFNSKLNPTDTTLLDGCVMGYTTDKCYKCGAECAEGDGHCLEESVNCDDESEENPMYVFCPKRCICQGCGNE